MVKKNVKTQKLSIERQIMGVFNELVNQLPFVKGLVEVDITEAREIISNYSSRSGTKISLTAWIIRAISQALMEYPKVQAYNISKRKIAIPDEVNFGIMVERKTFDGKNIPSMELIKSSQNKNTIEISKEIREFQERVITEEELLMGGQNFTRKLQYFLFAILPSFISKRILKKVALNKEFLVRFSGTVGVTALGMFGKNASGHVIHFPTRTVDLAIGTISYKPRYIDNKLMKREIMNMTFYVDHNIVDGAQAARFVARAIELLESAAGLEDLK